MKYLILEKNNKIVWCLNVKSISKMSKYTLLTGASADIDTYGTNIYSDRMIEPCSILNITPEEVLFLLKHPLNKLTIEPSKIDSSARTLRVEEI